MASFEELKAKMKKSMINASTKVLVGKTEPITYSDIPQLFEGWDESASKAVRGALWIAKKYDLIPKDSPLRQVWYMFMKLVFQKLHPSKRVAHAVDSFYKSFADIMKRTDFWYKDFNVVNPPSDFKEVDRFWSAELFPNVLLALEKESYYSSMQTFANLLGINLYASGGMSSFSKAEDISRKLHDAHPKKDLNIYTISDYDPAGFNISENLQKHFYDYLKRSNQNVIAHKLSPYPKDYTPKELKQSGYIVKPGTVKQARWNKDERIQERIDTDFIDHRFEDLDFYNIDKGSEIRDVLTEGDLDKKDHTKWINEWRKRVEGGEIPHMLGLEVESLPRKPLPEQMPHGMSPDDATGNARMRLLVYNKLIHDFELQDVIKKLYTKHFIDEYPSHKAWEIFKEKADIQGLEDLKEEIDEKIDDLISRQENVLEGDYEILEEQLEEWIDEIGDDNVEKFEQALRKAVAIDQEQSKFIEDYDFSEIEKEINDYELEVDTIERIDEESERNIEILNNILEQLKKELGDENG